MAWSGYKSRRWRRMRLAVLRRDGYRCRESARYGKRVEATTVHHVWPAMHDRRTGRLTMLGESWRRRISPQGSNWA